jgi:hypothetical protein
MKLPPTEKPLTLKQERFAQLVIEKQGRLSEAYREAYDADNMTDESVKVSAHRLLIEKKEVTTPQGVKFVMMAPDATRKTGD